MSQRIILLCNTCPFGGEVFLQNELRWIPHDREVVLYPIFASDTAEQTISLSSNIEVRKLGTRGSCLSRLTAGWNSLRMFVITNEYSAALKKANPLRNLMKALKFAYISELRVREIAEQLKKEPKHENGYILYSYWFYEAAYIAARLKKFFPASRFVSRCHGYDLYAIRHQNGYLPFRRYLMKSVDGIYPISEDGESYIRKLYDESLSGKAQVMRIGTEDHGINPVGKEDVPVIVSCSNLVDVKRIDRLIDGLKGSTRALKWYHFGDGILREQLESEAQKIPSHIQWAFMGSVPNEQLMRFYKENHIDVFVNVSASEGIPVSVMEALSFGIPVIATDVGGTHEIVEHKKNGYLLPVDFTREMLLEDIEKILFSKDAELMRVMARKMWNEKCNAETNFNAFFETILK